MKTPAAPDFAGSPAVLAAFVRAVATAGDSPTVIRRVAADAAYVDLCRRIAALEAAAGTPPALEEACRRAGLPLPRLQARLRPVALALRLAPPTAAADYYRVLGIAPDSDAAAIRAAYRRRARERHPDAQPGQPADSGAFAELAAAYETLRDPVAREAYDQNRRDPGGAWFEPPPRRRPAAPRRFRPTAVIVVVVFLALAALVLDQWDRETARHTRFHPPRPPAAQAEPPAAVTASLAPLPDAPGPGAGAAGIPSGAPAAPQAPLPPVAAPAAPESQPPPAAAPPAHPLSLPDERTPAGDPAELPIVPAATDAAPGPPPAPTGPPGDPAPKTAAPAPPPARAARAPAATATRMDREDPALRRLVVFHPAAASRLAEDLQAHLAAARFPSPELALSPEDAAASANNVRYFSTADRPAARSLRSAVQDFLSRTAGPPDPRVGLVNLARRYPDAAPGHLEVWLAAPAAPAAPAGPAAARAPAATAEDRIRTFLSTYCRTYESRDTDRLAALFDPHATENGLPVTILLPRYRANLGRMTRLAYHVDMKRWQGSAEAGSFLVEGRFTARGELADHRHYHRHGTIALNLVPHGDTFRIRRLEYEIE